MGTRYTSVGTGRGAVQLIALVVASVLILTGCSRRVTAEWMTLSPSDVVGSWCGQAGDFLTILDDERFFLDQMSASLYEPTIDRLYPPGNLDRPKTKDPASATGNWYLLELQNIHRLKLSVDKIDKEVVSFNITLIGSEIDGEVALLFYPSDPDVGYADKFTKCEKPQPGAPADSAAVD